MHKFSTAAKTEFRDRPLILEEFLGQSLNSPIEIRWAFAIPSLARRSIDPEIVFLVFLFSSLAVIYLEFLPHPLQLPALVALTHHGRGQQPLHVEKPKDHASQMSHVGNGATR